VLSINYNALNFYCHFFACPKKGPLNPRLTGRAGMTARFRPPAGGLIKLLYYCSFNIGNLPAGRQVLLLGAMNLQEIKAAFGLMKK